MEDAALCVTGDAAPASLGAATETDPEIALSEQAQQQVSHFVPRVSVAFLVLSLIRHAPSRAGSRAAAQPACRQIRASAVLPRALGRRGRLPEQ